MVLTPARPGRSSSRPHEVDSEAHRHREGLGGPEDRRDPRRQGRRQGARPRPAEGRGRTTSRCDGADAVAIGLRGHVMETMFPNTYRRWSLKYLGEMIREPDLAWVVDGGAAGTVAALRTVAKGATELVIATDYDREGELIGHEALRDPARRRAQAAIRTTSPRRRSARRRPPRTRPPRRAPRRRRPSRSTAATRTSSPCCRRPSSTGTSGYATRRSRPRRSRPPSTSLPPSTSTWPRRRTRGRTSTSSGARCSHGSCRWRRTATAPTTSRWAASSRRRCASSSTVSSSAARSSPCPTGSSRPTLDYDGEPFEVAHAKGRFDTPGRQEAAYAGAQVDDRRGHRLQGRAAPGQAAGAVQHHGAHERRVRLRHDSGAGHARRRVAVPRRPHQLPAYRQHGLSAVAGPARQPARALALAAGRRHGCAAGRPGQAHRRLAARSAPPTTRRSTRWARPRRS